MVINDYYIKIVKINVWHGSTFKGSKFGLSILKASTLHWEGLCIVGDLCTHKIRASWSRERSEIGSSFLRMKNAFGSGLLKLFLVFGCKGLWILPSS
jgi:hypothetical protein